MNMQRLEKSDELADFVYHLKGILEADREISSLIRRLNQVIERDDEETGDILAAVDVAVFFHLSFHIKKLRAPFKRLVAKLESKGKGKKRSPSGVRSVSGSSKRKASNLPKNR